MLSAYVAPTMMHMMPGMSMDIAQSIPETAMRGWFTICDGHFPFSTEYGDS